jgi:hypothetical protein
VRAAGGRRHHHSDHRPGRAAACPRCNVQRHGSLQLGDELLARGGRPVRPPPLHPLSITPALPRWQGHCSRAAWPWVPSHLPLPGSRDVGRGFRSRRAEQMTSRACSRSLGMSWWSGRWPAGDCRSSGVPGRSGSRYARRPDAAGGIDSDRQNRHLAGPARSSAQQHQDNSQRRQHAGNERRNRPRRTVSGATADGALIGGVQGSAAWPAGLHRCFANRPAGWCPARRLRFGAGRRGSLGQDLLMAIFFAGSRVGSGMRISRTPSL